MRFPRSLAFLIFALALTSCAPEEPVEAAVAPLPDWSGIWMGTGTLFDQSSGITNPNTNREARDHPPYRPEWEAAYTAFLESVVRQGRYSDPLSLGYPPGMLRNMSLPYGIQFVMRPEMVWVIHEGPHVRYIYTDGRPFPPAEELWPTFEGYSIGHWEGDTLVVETVSIKGGVPVDRTGLVFSDEMRVTERIRKTSDTTLVNEITIEDPQALTAPWTVTRNYNKRPEEFPRMENVPILENQRNPVVDGVTQTLLADEIEDSDSPYPADLRALALPNVPAE